MHALAGSQGLASIEQYTPCPVSDGPASKRLAVVRLTLTDFRCYHHQRMETDQRPVVLSGANGAGKTNILEALSFLVPGRGLRKARLDEVARHKSFAADEPETTPAWAVAARICTPDGEVDVGTGEENSPAGSAKGSRRRAVHVDGQKQKSQAALAEVLSVNWLTPSMDRLFSEGAASRRRFLDHLIFGFDPAHAGRVSAYTHALRERTRLLRQQQDGYDADADWLTTLEDTMARKGVAVAAARRETIIRLDSICATKSGHFPGARLEVRGEIECWLDNGPALEAEDRLRAQLLKMRKTDAENGNTCIGAHKSDFAVKHLSKGCPAAICSTGEQKALLITIVLANARLQTEHRGTIPILLLDEVVAHLDNRRREALFAEIKALGSQTWFTGTDSADFSALSGEARFFTVTDGVVTGAK